MSALSDFKHFKHFTDDELTKYEFTVDDPRDIEGLVWTVPKDVTIVALLHRYIFPSEKLNCIVCHEARHHSGGVALLSDGSKCLIGNDCGRKTFGKELWDQRISEFEKAQNRRELLDRSAQIYADVASQLKSAQQLESSYRGYAHLQKATIDCIRKDYRRLIHDLHESGGQLGITARKSEIVKDAFRGLSSSSTRSDKLTRSAYETQPIGRIRGYRFLSGKSPLELLRDGLSGLRAVQEGLASGDINDQGRKKLHRKYDDARQAMIASAEVYQQAFVFHQTANYKVLGEWLNQNEECDLEARLSATTFATRLKVPPARAENSWCLIPTLDGALDSPSSVFELMDKIWPSPAV
ncbi:MAG: hypothetical protein P1U69_11850 [Parvibaculaceae bacterium]|nr:hypothetical protein [Parvibaculaceae bacterium]HBM88668.1 hypothetical protein [Rhodobiaceae bacterium]|tara:strand:+ start:1164 stop:2219 length:1056 start_codon:yes stop_codon:yes gene_type:complete